MSHETPPSPAESCTRWPSGYKSSPALACKSCRVKHQPLWPIGNNDPVVTLISRRHGRKPTRERGRPARTTLAKPRPSPRPGSTGKDARALLGPGPCGSRRQGGRVRHRRETERQPKGEDAGGTPALPGGPLSSRLPFKGESAQTNWLDGRLKSRFDNHFVALPSPSCHFVDHSFIRLFQIIFRTFRSNNSPLSTIHFSPGCAAVPYNGAADTE